MDKPVAPSPDSGKARRWAVAARPHPARLGRPGETEERPMNEPETASEVTGSIVIPIGARLDQAEREIILRTLAANANNKTRTAEILGITAKTIDNKLHRYGVSSEPIAVATRRRPAGLAAGEEASPSPSGERARVLESPAMSLCVVGGVPPAAAAPETR